jgi:hypothetical protein
VQGITFALILASIAVTSVQAPLEWMYSARRKWMLEATVMVLQLGGALSLLWSKLVPASGRAAKALVGTQFGLGTAGALCARLGSCFTLFAGATLVVLFLGAIHGSDVASDGAREHRAEIIPGNG